MSGTDQFLTVSGPASGTYKDKGSTFQAFIFPLRDESEVKMLVTRLHKEHPKARHICYAYRFGPDPEYARVQDDGEPPGTAGRPILSQLKSHHLENTLIAVVRYFGGTLLGTSGLIQAYKQAAADAVTRSEIITRHREAQFRILFPYTLDKPVTAWLKSIPARDLKKQYAELIEARFSVPVSMAGEFMALFQKTKAEHQWPEFPAFECLSTDAF
ncbi:MAG TPA: YigZ family protein [Saprospiraceae bacterium]|nr:YigZ family protein [Saprospiraceae bacterium]HNT21819.1 YigZ family protein [Saprospiraceae bacterium]